MYTYDKKKDFEIFKRVLEIKPDDIVSDDIIHFLSINLFKTYMGKSWIDNITDIDNDNLYQQLYKKMCLLDRLFLNIDNIDEIRQVLRLIRYANNTAPEIYKAYTKFINTYVKNINLVSSEALTQTIKEMIFYLDINNIKASLKYINEIKNIYNKYEYDKFNEVIIDFLYGSDSYMIIYSFFKHNIFDKDSIHSLSDNHNEADIDFLYAIFNTQIDDKSFNTYTLKDRIGD